MKYELYTRMALSVDLPEHGLRRGDVATLVEHHPGRPVPPRMPQHVALALSRIAARLKLKSIDAAEILGAIDRLDSR